MPPENVDVQIFEKVLLNITISIILFYLVILHFVIY